MRAGAAVVDITPALGVANGGVIARGGPVTHIHDGLHARCLVLDDGATRLAIAICDMRMLGGEVVARAKSLAGEATGLAPENILIAATHTHAAPAMVGIHPEPRDRAYAEFVARRIADGITRAGHHLAPAKVGWGFGSAPQHVHNRRWFMKPVAIAANPFGGGSDEVKMNPPRGTDLLKPAGPVDPQVSVLDVRHADGRPLAVLANYGLHYVGGYQAGHVSADYFGLFADRVQGLLGADRQHPPFVAMMSNGTSGDVSINDFSAKQERLPAWVKMQRVADDLAAEVVKVTGDIGHHTTAPLAVAATELQLGVRRPDAKRLVWARRTLAYATDPKRLTRPVIYAQETLALAKFPAKVPVALQAFRIGDLRIITVPCEMFAETGLALKQEAGLGPLFIIELANGYRGYLPTPRQHEWGGYETWPARSSYLEVQAAPKIRAALLGLLGKL
ncbi:MAG: neutral/alkaline non-lysosomal ceramidase N-terminal domain-containing protein [Pedosphaera sp.]|nr:neutral/alkaline non-lysosomal ceramidase N-terminal domain-containing protein [Pedosphaera sp.]